MPLIEARGVTKRFGDNEVLKGIDLDVDERQVVCIIGPSGCGKSTLLRCLTRLVPANEGTIRLAGVDVLAKDADIRKVREEFVMVFQQFNLFPHLRVRENITLPLREVLSLPRAEADARANETLARVGLAEKKDAYPGELSGGQQQRVAIARAIAMRPRAILFDEPTSALDPELTGEVLRVMRQLAQDGMTMLVVTPAMGFAKEVADRVVFMDAGRIVEEGPASEVLERPATERMREFLARYHAR